MKNFLVVLNRSSISKTGQKIGHKLFSPPLKLFQYTDYEATFKKSSSSYSLKLILVQYSSVFIWLFFVYFFVSLEVLKMTKFDKEKVKIYSYSLTDFHTKSSTWKNNDPNSSPATSIFDQKLAQKWQQAQEADAFAFKFSRDMCEYKSLDTTKFGIDGPLAVQLNNLRGLKKRTRPDFESMEAEFSDNSFNFKKIGNNEILFRLKYHASEAEKSSSYFIQRNFPDSENYLIINAAPIEFGHSLIVPQLEAGKNHVMNAVTLRVSLDILLLSNQPSFRVMFGGIWAWGSVNHLHMHAFYHEQMCGGDVMSVQEQPIFRSNFPGVAETDQLILRRSVDQRVYCPAFVWDNIVTENSESHFLNSNLAIQQIITFTTHLVAKLIPHNIMILYHGVTHRPRIIVWPRKSAKGAQPDPSFDSAVAELGGHFPHKTLETFERTNVSNMMQHLRYGPGGQGALLPTETYDQLETFLREQFT